MPGADDSKSAEDGRDNWNLMATDNRSKCRWQSQSPVLWIGAATVCLGLLLIVILGVVAHNGSAISEWNRLCVGLVKRETLVNNLTKDRDTLRDQQDQLRINISSLAKEMEVLQSQCETVVASRDALQEELKSRTDKLCYQGWIKFNNKCYYASEKGTTKTWEDSRKDCLQRRADLVIITTKDELDFVTKFYSTAWIGLSDTQEEGKWKWVDGTHLSGSGFWRNGEPNSASEHCVELYNSNGEWNDAYCSNTNPWICED